MGKYVDGFIVPVERKNLEKYRKVAKKAAKIWKEYGALEYMECLEDDVKDRQMDLIPAEREAKKERSRFLFLDCL